MKDATSCKLRVQRGLLGAAGALWLQEWVIWATGPTTAGSQCRWLWPGHYLPVVPFVATAVGFCCTTEMFSFPFISPLSAFPPVTRRDIWPCDCIWIIYTFSWNEAHSEERKPFTLRLRMQEARGLQCLLCPRHTSRGLPSGWEAAGRSWAPNYVPTAEVVGTHRPAQTHLHPP